MYEGAIIAIDKDVDKHIKLIDDEIPPSVKIKCYLNYCSADPDEFGFTEWKKRLWWKCI